MYCFICQDASFKNRFNKIVDKILFYIYVFTGADQPVDGEEDWCFLFALIRDETHK